jgi:hypothetical protein
MSDYASRLPVNTQGIYSSPDNVNPSTNGVTAHVRTYAGVHAALTVATDITYTAVAVGAVGNTISLVYTGTGTAGAETVVVTGTGPWTITVDLDATPVTGSTATQVVTAITNSVAASALVTAVVVAGHGGNVQALFSTTPLAGGIDAILSDDAALQNRVTSIVDGTVTALDVAIRNSNGTAIDGTNPLHVYVENNQGGTEVFKYQPGVDIAKNLTDTNTYTPTALKTFTLQKVYASCSGKCRIEVKWGPTGSELTKLVAFNSSANPNWEYSFQVPQALTSTSSVKVIVTNLDVQPTNTYSSIEGVES